MSEKSDSKTKNVTKNASPAPSDWFVRMSNGSVFGPINVKGLVYWASDGRILPDDEVSTDRTNWRPARELAELKMNIMIERPDGAFMGPFNAQAIEPLIQEGKIPPRSKPFPVEELEARKAFRQATLFDDTSDRDMKEGVSDMENTHHEKEQGRMQEAFEEHVEAIRREADDKISELTRTVETLEAEQDLLKAQAKEPNAARVAAEEKADKLEAELKDLRVRLAKSEASLFEARSVDNVPQADYAAIVAEKKALEGKLSEQEVASRDASEGAQQKLDDMAARCTELQAEYSELLAFSNARDSEGKEKIRVLEAELAEMKESFEARGLVPVRRVESLESQIAEAFSERDLLKEQLAEAVAARAIDSHPVEGDIALVKLFSEGALEMMRKTLALEKVRNTAARAASAELQGLIHTEIERLERVRARDPGEISRAEKMGQRAEHQIAKLQQEVESVRRHHQADMARAEANEKAMAGRFKALTQKEVLLREKLSRVEQRTAEYDSLSSQLLRKENALLGAEKEFEEARQQWQVIEATLQHRIEELERGAGLLFDSDGENDSVDAEGVPTDTDSKSFRVQPWMRRMKRN